MKQLKGGADLTHLVLLSLVSMATVWITMFAWRGLTHAPGAFLGPMLMIGFLVAGIGVFTRWLRWPALVILVLQILLAGSAAAYAIAGSAPEGLVAGLRARFEAAVHSANTFAPPVPAEAPSVVPLLILGGLGCLLLVDFLANTLQRPTLASLPLLAVYAVPISLTGDAVSWWIFVAAAIGLVTMLYLDHRRELSRWGRGLPHSEEHEPDLAIDEERIVTAASGIGASSIAVALIGALAVPTFGLSMFEGGFGAGRGGDIEIQNPMTDLERDLLRGPDLPLLTASTTDPDPTYLRIAVLARLNDEQWSTGDREVPQEQVAEGPMPPLVGVAPGVPRTTFEWSVHTQQRFDSLWLPTAEALESISAPGDWRYDLSTMDFLSGSNSQRANALDYDFTRIVLDRDALAMNESPAAPSEVRTDFTQVPSTLDERVRSLARQVTEGATTRFRRAQLLQEFFRSSGEFTYNDSYTGEGTLTSFLFGDRTGYCEQFSSSMAMMARTLGIPARVAVGFLRGERTGVNEAGVPSYTFSTHDLHAWPELFFPGSGWVRFEPTPAARVPQVPGYTTAELPEAPTPTTSAPTAQPSNDLPTRAPQPTTPQDELEQSTDAGGWWGISLTRVLQSLGAVALLGLLICGPRLARRIRSQRRWRSLPAAEAAWVELRDHARDLGIAWLNTASPRRTAERAAASFGGRESSTRRGPDAAPEAYAALLRIVREVELGRYARRPGEGDVESLRADVAVCVAAWEAGATGRVRRLSSWWPRSLGRLDRARAASGPLVAADGERLVDRVR